MILFWNFVKFGRRWRKRWKWEGRTDIGGGIASVGEGGGKGGDGSNVRWWVFFCYFFGDWFEIGNGRILISLMLHSIELGFGIGIKRPPSMETQEVKGLLPFNSNSTFPVVFRNVLLLLMYIIMVSDCVQFSYEVIVLERSTIRWALWLSFLLR